MKKLFIFAFALFIVTNVFAGSSFSNIGIDEQVLNEYKDLIAVPEVPRSYYASTRSIIDMKLTLIGWDYSNAASVPLDPNDSDEKWRRFFKEGWADKIEYGSGRQPVCKMVKISSNWLIGDSHCLPEYIRQNPEINSVPSKKEAFKLREFKSMQTENRGLVYEIENNEARVDGKKIDTANHLFIGKDVMLLYVPDEVVTPTFHGLSLANIRISKNPSDIKTIWVNGEEITTPKVTENQIEVSSKSKGGTPAFYKKGYEEFLIGFNAADRGEKSKVFKLLTEDMESFIEKSVKEHTPDEWDRTLKHKIVHDAYFNK